jgi:hypothetical protein
MPRSGRWLAGCLAASTSGGISGDGMWGCRNRDRSSTPATGPRLRRLTSRGKEATSRLMIMRQVKVAQTEKPHSCPADGVGGAGELLDRSSAWRRRLGMMLRVTVTSRIIAAGHRVSQCSATISGRSARSGVDGERMKSTSCPTIAGMNSGTRSMGSPRTPRPARRPWSGGAPAGP